jgi:hypothetical protein
MYSLSYHPVRHQPAAHGLIQSGRIFAGIGGAVSLALRHVSRFNAHRGRPNFSADIPTESPDGLLDF